jgi:hypothetical protein
VPDPGYCILVNRKHPPERRRWTLSHEYAHFLADRHRPAVDTEQAAPPREAALLQPLIESGLLTIGQAETDAELAACVTFARELDDGEAMALATAHTRGWQIAVDDRRAIQLATEASIWVLTTPAVVKRWVDRSELSPAEVKSALAAIRNRARFLPSGRDPLCDCWMQQQLG